MSDVFDEIAASVKMPIDLETHAERDRLYAAAFRDHFAQRTCATCRHWLTHGGCTEGVAVLDHQEHCSLDRTTFSCSLYEPKP